MKGRRISKDLHLREVVVTTEEGRMRMEMMMMMMRVTVSEW